MVGYVCTIILGYPIASGYTVAKQQTGGVGLFSKEILWSVIQMKSVIYHVNSIDTSYITSL